MITVGSVAREIATARFPFLAEHYPGRRSAIRDLTHRDPEFVFWIYPDGRLHDARRSHRDNVPKGCQHILADEPYFLFLTVVLASIPFPFPFWAGLLVGLLVGGGAFLRERYRWVRDTPQCIEVTAVGLTVTEKLSVPQSVEWAAVRKVASDDELGGWRIEMADRVLRFGVAGLSLQGMSAIESAIRENSRRYDFEVQEMEIGEDSTTEEDRTRTSRSSCGVKAM